MSRTAADYMAQALAQAGVERIFGVVGDSLNGFTDSLRTEPLQTRNPGRPEAINSRPSAALEGWAIIVFTTSAKATKINTAGVHGYPGTLYARLLAGCRRR